MNKYISGFGEAMEFQVFCHVRVRLTSIINGQHIISHNVYGLVCDSHAALCVSVSVDPHVDMVFKTREFQSSAICEHVKSFLSNEKLLSINFRAI